MLRGKAGRPSPAWRWSTANSENGHQGNRKQSQSDSRSGAPWRQLSTSPRRELDTYEQYEQAWWDAEGDNGEGDKEILDFNTRIPEVTAGKMAELAKMDKYDTYEPRPLEEAKGKKILDSTWVITEKPNRAVKCRFLLAGPEEQERPH